MTTWIRGSLDKRKQSLFKKTKIKNVDRAFEYEYKSAKDCIGSLVLGCWRRRRRSGSWKLFVRGRIKAGILDYCKENGITFYSYMIPEQGRLLDGIMKQIRSRQEPDGGFL